MMILRTFIAPSNKSQSATGRRSMLNWRLTRKATAPSFVILRPMLLTAGEVIDQLDVELTEIAQDRFAGF
jgi:hypothetical protein